MKQSIVKFLEFNGQNLLFVSKNGTQWVAIKPICEALSLNFNRQFKNLKVDAILGPALAVQPIQVPGDQLRKMVCLPEYLVYGWIFSIQSANKQLVEYKKECYKLLYDYFHGTITGRRELLTLKARTEVDRSRLEMDLRSNPSFQKWEDLKAQEARIGKQLKTADRDEIIEQISLFEQ